jgi:hypothetical protein
MSCPKQSVLNSACHRTSLSTGWLLLVSIIVEGPQGLRASHWSQNNIPETLPFEVWGLNQEFPTLAVQ